MLLPPITLCFHVLDSIKAAAPATAKTNKIGKAAGK